MTTLQTPLQRAKALAARMDTLADEISKAPHGSNQFFFLFGALLLSAEMVSNAVKQLTDEDAS